MLDQLAVVALVSVVAAAAAAAAAAVLRHSQGLMNNNKGFGAGRASSRLLHGKRALLVIAHPDDECMFFAPSILALQSAPFNSTAFVLCLSTGNYDGLGAERRRELVRSCEVLGVPPGCVRVLDEPELQDGPHAWDAEAVAAAVQRVFDDIDGDIILSFDGRGVSGHPNHISCSAGLHLLAARATERGDASTASSTLFLELVSVSLLRKYVRVLRVPALDVSGRHTGRFVLRGEGGTAWEALKQHSTQLVWFRRLYALFSRYMTENELVTVTA